MNLIILPKVEREVEVAASVKEKSPKKTKKTKSKVEKEPLAASSVSPDMSPSNPTSQVQVPPSRLWHQKMVEVDRIIMEEFKVDHAKNAPSPALKKVRELVLAAGVSNIKLMTDNDQLAKLLAEEKRCGRGRGPGPSPSKA